MRKKLLMIICTLWSLKLYSQLQYADTKTPSIIELNRNEDINIKVKKSIQRNFLWSIKSSKKIEQKVFNYLKLHENIDVDTLSNFNIVEHNHNVSTTLKGIIWNDIFIYEYIYNFQFELFQINKVKTLSPSIKEVFDKEINESRKIEYQESHGGGIWLAISFQRKLGKNKIKTAFYY